MKDDFNMKGKDLDRELNSPAQQRVRSIVHALPEETLSLTWRSELNARLRSESARLQRVSLMAWLWKPAAGVAVASALAVAFVYRMPNMGAEPRAQSVEQALVGTYVDTSATLDLAGDVTPMGDREQSQKPLPSDWDQEDVGATL